MCKVKKANITRVTVVLYPNIYIKSISDFDEMVDFILSDSLMTVKGTAIYHPPWCF